jgi:hypothetical protein
MRRLRAWFFRFLGLFRKNRRNAEMAEEIQQHVDLLTERNIAAGMSPIDARHAALRQFGGIRTMRLHYAARFCKRENCIFIGS